MINGKDKDPGGLLITDPANPQHWFLKVKCSTVKNVAARILLGYFRVLELPGLAPRL